VEVDTPRIKNSADSWFNQSTYYKTVTCFVPEVVLSPSFFSHCRELFLNALQYSSKTQNFVFSGTWCMKILPSYAFLARTLYFQFSRCVSPSTTGCFTWLNTLTTKLVYNYVFCLSILPNLFGKDLISAA
jgi:hypothetical protein